MQRSRGKITNDGLTRRFDGEQRDARQAQARLANGLQQLEDARLYHLNNMLREQKHVKQDLRRLRQGTVSGKSSCTPGTQPQQRQHMRASLAGTQASVPRTHGSANRSLQSRVEEFINAEKAEPETDSAGHEEGTGDSEVLQEVRSEPSSPVSSLSFDPEIMAPGGHLRTIHALPSFSEALHEARKARYIRHRRPLESERELTMQQIFQRGQSPVNQPPSDGDT
ncbi:coiled-coil domain-containing protein 190 [Erpetoichthys calabaricus]|uniref:coiled-coil domain-containing protein 190 n=1 Tax=Erpetoichthys calabaricus TaxID=27687 RepID=UPI002234C8AC|nr:coiled-coil domain-containing protein 190 [Erpetoichthys calabaricus]